VKPFAAAQLLARSKAWLPARVSTVSALSVAFLVSGTAILSVILGVLGAYFAITGILAAVNPARSFHPLAALIPHQSHASGD
jgi:hypothetical protein